MDLDVRTCSNINFKQIALGIRGSFRQFDLDARLNI